MTKKSVSVTPSCNTKKRLKMFIIGGERFF